jgi:hypothetical protein
MKTFVIVIILLFVIFGLYFLKENYVYDLNEYKNPNYHSDNKNVNKILKLINTMNYTELQTYIQNMIIASLKISEIKPLTFLNDNYFTNLSNKVVLLKDDIKVNKNKVSLPFYIEEVRLRMYPLLSKNYYDDIFVFRDINIITNFEINEKEEIKLYSFVILNIGDVLSENINSLPVVDFMKSNLQEFLFVINKNISFVLNHTY